MPFQYNKKVIMLVSVTMQLIISSFPIVYNGVRFKDGLET